MEETKTREFKLHVVRIIDKSTIIINIGDEENEELYRQNLDEFATRIGDKIKVVMPGPMIIDPISKEELGYLDSTKEVLEIIELYPKMALCQKVKRETQTSPSALDMLGSLRGEKIETTQIIPLNVDEFNIEPVELDKTPIQVGDPVIFI
ncbi:hypothetical protein [Enterococcus wangshanyuanii]|uniref:Uncharacterized protein n=1 Tax=Enterococcus wangshanyuanii TaxID=2005703 RepID=A0ABQ1PRV8_9ENTE|nr:hypothetical protein [Enterococcus wangshanyuanii]GGD02423.1 hypothetical protein GCM10011573_34820 [Enterococcus wangshanyuanii]